MSHVVGVIALNALFLLAGTGVLWGIRGWSSWGEYASLGGVAYLLGLCSVCVLETLVLVYGGGASLAAIVLLAAGTTLAGLLAGALVRRPLPARPRLPRPPSGPAGYVPLGFALLACAILAAIFRAARARPLTAWDAWSFWMTKAKAIYFFGGLDPAYFKTLWGPTYPLLVPTLAAMDFRFMGAADTTTLAVQWWFLLVGLVWGAAGLLRRLAPTPVVGVFLLTALVIPELDRNVLDRTADWPLDILFGISALALLGWILTGERWRLWGYGISLAAVIATKREGLLLALCLGAAGIAAAGWRSPRRWLWIVIPTAAAYVANLPWRIWWSSRHLGPDSPPGGILHATFANIGRAGDAFHLVLRLLLTYDMWLAVVPIVLAAALLGLVLPDRRMSVFILAGLVFGVAGWAWENWAWSQQFAITSDPAINPTSRTVGSLVAFGIVTGPAILGRLVAQRARRAATAQVPVT